MKTPINPITSPNEFKAVCSTVHNDLHRVVDYVINELTTNILSLSKEEFQKVKHHVNNLEDLITKVKNSSIKHRYEQGDK